MPLSGINGNDDLINIFIYNFAGNCVRSKKTFSKEMEISNIDLSDGIYFVKVQPGNDVANVKVVIEK